MLGLSLDLCLGPVSFHPSLSPDTLGLGFGPGALVLDRLRLDLGLLVLDALCLSMGRIALATLNLCPGVLVDDAAGLALGVQKSIRRMSWCRQSIGLSLTPLPLPFAEVAGSSPSWPCVWACASTKDSNCSHCFFLNFGSKLWFALKYSKALPRLG